MLIFLAIACFQSTSSIAADAPTSDPAACTSEGTLDYIEMRMTMAMHHDDIQNVYQAFAADNPGHGGRLEFNITIMPSGDVEYIKATRGAELLFSEAIKNKIRTLRFPACAKPSHFKHSMFFGPSIDASLEVKFGTCLSQREIQKTIESRYKEIISVYRQALKNSPELKGTIAYRISVFPSGNTESVSIEQGWQLTFAEEIREILLSFIFPSCDQSTIFTFPIRFLPSP